MNEDVLNISLRKYLKKVGVTSQREIEQAVRTALDQGKIDGKKPLRAETRLVIPEIGLEAVIDGAIELE